MDGLNALFPPRCPPLSICGEQPAPLARPPPLYSHSRPFACGHLSLPAERRTFPRAATTPLLTSTPLYLRRPLLSIYG